MKNLSLLYCAIICAVFLICNLLKVGSKNKSFILPSTIFALIWGITSIGGFLFSNGYITESRYYINADNLGTIGNYQFAILLVVFFAFICAHIRLCYSAVSISIDEYKLSIRQIRKKLTWIIVLFFIFGLIRLIIVVSVTGFDYAAMRAFYVESSARGFGILFNNFHRICGYLMQLSVFYVCLLGVENGIVGLNLKQVLFYFILFCPYQLSMGGRLFIISFFVPFVFSYLLILFASDTPSAFRKKQMKRFGLLAIIPLVLLVFFQILKMGETVSVNSFKDYSVEFFYSVSSYMHMNEFWESLPYSFDCELGKNCLGLKSKIYSDILGEWKVRNNPALVCTPSMIPQMYLDFGYLGSLIVYFLLFYNLERYAIKCLTKNNIRYLLIFTLLCTISFSTATSRMSDILKSFIIGYILIYILDKFIIKLKR